MESVKNCSIDEINLQLQRILDFPAFVKSPTLSKFLKFIISETVHKRDQYIKEYSIAVNVLNRPHAFNPNNDAVVRIHAGRLRRALNDYYLTAGIHDQVIIQIPKGSYVPKFDQYNQGTHYNKQLPGLSQKSIYPVVAVFPFRILSQRQGFDEFTRVLGEKLSAELSRFRDIAVVGYYSTEMLAKIKENIIEAGKEIGADYIITGNIQYTDNQIHVFINLIITSTGEVLLTKSFDEEISINESFNIQNEIVQNVIAAIGCCLELFTRNNECSSLMICR